MGDGGPNSDIEIGAGVYTKWNLWNNVAVVPTIDLLYNMTEYIQIGTSSEDVSTEGLFYDIQVPITYTLPMNHMIYLMARLHYGASTSTGTYGIHIGYIMPFYKK
jgi:hypothetical protein